VGLLAEYAALWLVAWDMALLVGQDIGYLADLDFAQAAL
jgi:hypothetical protein